jgi:hypothetical protein
MLFAIEIAREHKRLPGIQLQLVCSQGNKVVAAEQ